MPWARTRSAMVAGSWPVWRNRATRSAGPFETSWATWLAASLRLAVPKTVTRMDSPREPPTCWVTFSRLEAAPASRGATPETATIVRGTNSRPMPSPNRSIGPRTSSR